MNRDGLNVQYVSYRVILGITFFISYNIVQYNNTLDFFLKIIIILPNESQVSPSMVMTQQLRVNTSISLRYFSLQTKQLATDTAVLYVSYFHKEMCYDYR